MPQKGRKEGRRLLGSRKEPEGWQRASGPGPPVVHGGHLAAPGGSKHHKLKEGLVAGGQKQHGKRDAEEVSPGVCVCPGERAPAPSAP